MNTKTQKFIDIASSNLFLTAGRLSFSDDGTFLTEGNALYEWQNKDTQEKISGAQISGIKTITAPKIGTFYRFIDKALVIFKNQSDKKDLPEYLVTACYKEEDAPFKPLEEIYEPNEEEIEEAKKEEPQKRNLPLTTQPKTNTENSSSKALVVTTIAVSQLKKSTTASSASSTQNSVHEDTKVKPKQSEDALEASQADQEKESLLKQSLHEALETQDNLEQTAPTQDASEVSSEEKPEHPEALTFNEQEEETAQSEGDSQSEQANKQKRKKKNKKKGGK